MQTPHPISLGTSEYGPEYHPEQLRGLYEAGIAVAGDIDLESVLQRVVDLARELAAATYGALGIFDDQNQIEQFVTSGVTTEERERLGPLPRGRGLLGEMLKAKGPVRVANIASHPASVGFPSGHPQMTSLLGVPITHRGNTLGILYLTNKRGASEFSEQDAALLQLFAAQAAGAVENAHLHQKTEQQALQLQEALRREQAALAMVAERFASLEELDRLKDDFISIASHDLKSPLTSIGGYAQRLRRLVANPTPNNRADVLDGLGVIVEQVAAMTRLLDDLLDASRIQAGALELRTTSCDLVECLDTILRRFNPEEQGRIEVHVAEMPLVGEWDQKRIEDVLGNLLRNALKYSPESGRVSVALEQRDREVEVAVTDRGMGIAPEELPQLFQRFHRTRQGRASGLPGTGLGLYISHGIIALHGGRIWAESPGEGKGATFRFILPVEPDR